MKQKKKFLIFYGMDLKIIEEVFYLFEKLLYVIAILFLIFSYFKDKQKTKKALKKSWKSFMNIFPLLSGIILLMGLVLTLLSPKIISNVIGGNSGFLGMLTTSIIGAITLIPGFIAFPLASSLLDLGAGVVQVAVFVSTLMMVGIVTAPLEIEYFGKKETLYRNFFSFIFSFIIAVVIGVVV